MSGSSLAVLSRSDISPAPCYLGLIGTLLSLYSGHPVSVGVSKWGMGRTKVGIHYSSAIHSGPPLGGITWAW